MGFYNEKLENYSKRVKLNPDIIEFEGFSILNKKEKEVKALEEELSHLKLMRSEEYENLFEDTIMKLDEEKKELDFMRTLSPIELIQFMVYVENYNLTKMIENMGRNKETHSGNLETYKNKKGILGKTSALFGVNKKLVDKHSKLLEDVNIELDVAKESQKEWKSLSPENQATYIIGRNRYEGLTKFDSKGFSTYKQLSARKNNVNENSTIEEENQPE